MTSATTNPRVHLLSVQEHIHKCARFRPRKKTHLVHQSPLGWGTLADPPRSKAGLKHHSPTSGRSAPKEVSASAGVGPMPISPREESTWCINPHPDIGGKCSPGGKLLCLGGVHTVSSPGKHAPGASIPTGVGHPRGPPPGTKWGCSTTPQHQGEVLPRW